MTFPLFDDILRSVRQSRMDIIKFITKIGKDFSIFPRRVILKFI